MHTDHKPLLTLFSSSRGIPLQVSARIQRWALTMAAYEYDIKYKKTSQHGNADGLSRLPLTEPDEEQSEVPTEVVLLVEALEDAPMTYAQIQRWTKRDPLLSKISQFILHGWREERNEGDEELKPYWTRRLELSLHEGCILWGNRVVIPTQGREYVLRELHGGHPGMSRMKAIARTLVWWPHMDQDIEGMVKRCEECQTQQASPPHAPLHPWKWPTRPWARLHVDFAGPMWGRMLLVVIDAHSKWIEVEDMKEATAGATIQRLRAMFARFGIPESLVSDNGPCFIRKEFKDFLRKNGVMHITSAPYHPASNGLAERAVRIIKEGLRKMKVGMISDKIARLLFQYRMTPQSVTKLSPAELLLFVHCPPVHDHSSPRDQY